MSAQQMRALSIRQPNAEAVMRGVKKIEYRPKPTHIRERVYVYASMGRYPLADEDEMMDEYRIRSVACDDLPRGVLIGTIEVYDCTFDRDRYCWHLRKPIRAKRKVKPKGRPQPAWFFPFKVN